MEGGGGNLSELYSSSKRLSLKIRDALERLERLDFTSTSSSSLSSSSAVVAGSSDDHSTLIRRDINQIQSLCAEMDRLWRSIPSKPQRDLWKRIDARSNNVTGKPILIHKKKSKVTGLHCHPLQPDLLLSCGNDHFARIWDIRRLEDGSSIYNLQHKRVVNSAYFSPQSGSKILTTSQDNRIRVWDSIFGDLDSPSREIVHSQDFNRHLTPFRAEWDPKDISEFLVVVGRYISENYNGVALHPIDFIDITNGQLVAEVMDPNIMTITPVNKLYPRDDVLASGSSRSIFIWKPQENTELEREEVANRIIICGKAEKSRKGKLDDDSGDDDMFDSKKNSKTKKIHVKSKVHGGKRKC